MIPRRFFRNYLYVVEMIATGLIITSSIFMFHITRSDPRPLNAGDIYESMDGRQRNDERRSIMLDDKSYSTGALQMPFSPPAPVEIHGMLEVCLLSLLSPFL